MTVAELIAELRSLPADLPVFHIHRNGDGCYEIKEIARVDNLHDPVSGYRGPALLI
jgi:hypothetical protein